MKEILKEIYKHEILYGSASIKVPNELIKEGYVIPTSDGFKLSEKGREKITIIVCGGVFDILHLGHVFFLEKAKKFGDMLIVIVARDSTVIRNKGRKPIIPEKQRVKMVNYLKPVDLAVLGKENDYIEIIEEINPDIIVFGPDQEVLEAELKEKLKERGINVKVEKIKERLNSPLTSTREILKKITERNFET